MPICIVWERPDGRVTIEYPAYLDHNRDETDTDAALRSRCVQKTRARLLLKYGSPESIPHEYDTSDLPTDETFNDAWVWDDRVVVDMALARVLHMGRIRHVRNIELVKLDVPFMRAIEVDDKAEQKRIADLKQTLRDIPQTFSLASYQVTKTLSNAWPERLKT